MQSHGTGSGELGLRSCEAGQRGLSLTGFLAGARLGHLDLMRLWVGNGCQASEGHKGRTHTVPSGPGLAGLTSDAPLRPLC